MQESYSKNYLNIYFYQILSIVLGFMSLFVVVPYLSSDKTTYGIYSVCTSVTVFLSYADLGFLGAGMKYAAESFSKNDREMEMKLVGFSHFVLFILITIFSIGFLYLSFNPQILISGILPGIQENIAHNLLLILAIFSPTIILQRLLQMIFGIRLQDYIFQRIVIIGNLVKIVSVFYFFEYRKYDIVGYFLFLQLVNLIVAIVGVLLAKKKYDYDFKLLVRYFTFSKEMFNKTKALAFSGIVVTISWVIYYEMDSFAIGKLLGANQVAIYAIGFTILTFFRSLLGVFFSPFSARFNHFIGAGKKEELKNFYLHVVKITFPIVVFPILAVVFLAEPIIISWVGIEYQAAVEIMKWLVFCNILAFISYPAGMLMLAEEKLKIIYMLSVFMPVFYWCGIFFTLSTLGLKSFAIFKAIVFLISGLFYLFYTLNFLQISLYDFFKKNILPYLPAIIILCLMMYNCNSIFIDGKDKINLVLNAGIVGFGIATAIGVSLFTVSYLRDYVQGMVEIILKKQ